MNRRWNDEHPYRIARADQAGYSECMCSLRTRLVGDGCQYCNPTLAAELADDPHPAMDDLDADVNLATFDAPRLDGFVEPGESELTAAREGIAALKWQHVIESSERKRRHRDATPCPIPYPNREGESL